MQDIIVVKLFAFIIKWIEFAVHVELMYSLFAVNPHSRKVVLKLGIRLLWRLIA